jgi:hypothetical protein
MIAVTGCSAAKFPACGFCVGGMSKKPTPLIIATLSEIRLAVSALETLRTKQHDLAEKMLLRFLS